MKTEPNDIIWRMACRYRVTGRRLPVCLFMLTLALGLTLLCQTGCRSPSEYRLEADKIAGDIIHAKTMQSLGTAREFNIERPSNILRRRLLTNQNLPYADFSSLGTDRLDTIEHWPEENYPAFDPSFDPIVLLPA